MPVTHQDSFMFRWPNPSFVEKETLTPETGNDPSHISIYTCPYTKNIKLVQQNLLLTAHRIYIIGRH